MSKLKGRKYEEIFSTEKSTQLKETRRKDGLNQYYDSVMKRLNEMNLKLLDDYKGNKYEHNFKCTICGNEFKIKYSSLKRRKIICNNCKSENPKPIK
ncbi:MAG: hypothetical protein ACOC1O_06185 [bacterium]